jgi:hypothetical protein
MTTGITNTSLNGHVGHAKEFAESKFFRIRQPSPAVCKHFTETLSVAVQSVAPQLPIQNVLISYLGPQTGSPDCRFSSFSSVPAGKCRDISSIRLQPNPLQFIFLTSYHPMLHSPDTHSVVEEITRLALLTALNAEIKVFW